MDTTFHHIAYRAFFFPTSLQLYGTPDNAIVIQLLKCCSRGSQPFVHVLQKEQLHKQTTI